MTHISHHTRHNTAQYICSITNTQHNILRCITQYRCMTYLSCSALHNTYAVLYINSTIWYNMDPASHMPRIKQYNTYTVQHAHTHTHLPDWQGPIGFWTLGDQVCTCWNLLGPKCIEFYEVTNEVFCVSNLYILDRQRHFHIYMILWELAS